MSWNLILQSISKYIALEEDEQEYFLSLLQYRKIRKKEFLVREGEVSRTENFVLSGCFRSYSIDDRGIEHVIMFASEGWWTGDLQSYLTGEPSKLYTEAIENSEILQLHKEDKQRLMERIPKFERFYRILFQNALMAQYQRIDQNLSLSGEQKYQVFRNKYPHLELRVPQKMIASYIGITPEFLSIIRRRMFSRIS